MAEKSNPLETNLLRTLITVSDAGSVSEASRRLGISQPAVQSHIARLEQMLGDPLFETMDQKTALTIMGRQILSAARQILEGSRPAPNLAAVAHSALRLGVSSIFVEEFAKNLGRLADHEMQVSSAVCTELADSFADQCVDVAMLLDVRDNRQKLDGHVVEEHPVEMVWIKSSGFVLDRSKPIPLAVWPGDRIAEAALDLADCDYRVLFRTNDYNTKLSAVRSGKYISIAPKYAAIPPLVIADDEILPSLPKTSALIAVRGGVKDARMQTIVSRLAATHR